MREIPKLAPEVELPRPRSSGVAVVAVAALAMFTAVGASAFVVRVRMGMGRDLCGVDRNRPPAAARLNLVEAFMDAAARQDDRTALELYRQIPEGLDRMRHLALTREVILARQMSVLEQELLTGDCETLRHHVAWLKQVAPEEQLSVRLGECGATRYIPVDLTHY
jgi:hypothetical protein